MSSVSNDVLEKVRRLLAQAESTPYEGEAGVFFAKAAELMARYGIERALLSATRHCDETPECRVLEIASPYARAKSGSSDTSVGALSWVDALHAVFRLGF